MSKRFWVILTFVLISCGQEDKDNIDNIQNSDGGRCRLTNNFGNTTVGCIEYPNSTSATDASANCQSVYNAGSTSGYSYESGENSDCAGDNLLGTCTGSSETTGTVYYYSDGSFWNATTAEADCTSFLSGTWSSS